MGGELRDNAESRIFTRSGAESPRLTVSTGEMAIFQGNRWSTPATAIADREQSMFATGFDFAYAGNIYRKAGDDLLAYKPQQTDASDKTQIADKPHEKLIPKDGQEYSLKQLLNDYKTPFIDAYERSKQLKDGEAGKSKTLEEVVDRLKDCPWADKIHFKFDSHAKNSEYDEYRSTITINPNHSTEKQIEEFVHESYHATHQFLDKLYAHGKLDPQTYTNTFMWGEVGSMLAEAAAHSELGHQGHVDFKYKHSDGKPDALHVDEYMKTHSKKDLFDFLYTNPPAGTGEMLYSAHYAANYDNYKNSFDQVRPAALQYVQQWARTGHQASDI